MPFFAWLVLVAEIGSGVLFLAGIAVLLFACKYSSYLKR